MYKKYHVLIILFFMNIPFINGQVTNPVFHSKASSSLGFQAYLNFTINSIVAKTLQNPFDTSDQVKNSILFFFKFNIDSMGNVENLHFSNGDPPKNYNQIKDTLTDTNRIIKLNYLLDSAMHHPFKNGYWVPAKNGDMHCKSKTMFVQIMYQPYPNHDSRRGEYFYFPIPYIKKDNNEVCFFKTNEDMTFLGCLYIDSNAVY